MIRSLFAVAFLFLATSVGMAGNIHWRHDYGAALAESSATGKPLFVHCSGPACVWCRALEKVYRDDSVSAFLNEHFVPYEITDDNFLNVLGVTRRPTMIHAAPDGTIVYRHEGYLSAPEVLRSLIHTVSKRK